ncbi:MAG TPA: Wzz/FepE/Etk N-terminal domain-containing protein [Gaiellaceae bacterium]|nr:Wzz/FepE/Etk N-terminal domain-containing protein [Gaiellaceae bacterium]
MNTSVHALARFWWLVVAGLVVGAIAAAAVYSQEAKPKYTATTNLFVNSASAPYLRTQQAQPSKGHTGPLASSSASDTQTLVNAANTYPLLIQSDKIAELREQKYGAIPGTVTANALNASTNTYGVFRPSPLPVIQVKATSKRASQAEQLADATVAAFQLWMRQQQHRHKIPPSQRISVQQLESPAVASNGGRGKGLPAFVGALVLLAFCGLAIAVDNSRPAGAAEAAGPRESRATPTQHSLEG